MNRNTTMASGLGSFQAPPGWRAKGYVNMYTMHKEFGGIDEDTPTNTFEWPKDYMGDPVNTQPSAEQYLVLFAGSLPQDGAGSGVSLPYLYAAVRLVYYVEFSNMVYPSES